MDIVASLSMRMTVSTLTPTRYLVNINIDIFIELYHPVVSRDTSFDLSFMFSMVLRIYHHNASFESLAEEYNNFNNSGRSTFIQFSH